MRLRKWTILLFASAFLAGCQTASHSCDGWKPIRPGAADVAAVSGGLARQILAHNEQGAAACGWTP